MKRAAEIVSRYAKHACIWFVPVFLLYGCLNRDPYLRIGEYFKICSISDAVPLDLAYHRPVVVTPTMTMEEWEAATAKSSWSIRQLRDYRWNDTAIIGVTEKGPFIADRVTGQLSLYATVEARDEALRSTYGTPPSAYLPPSELDWMKSDAGWPYFHLYFLGCLIAIPIIAVVQIIKRPAARTPR